VMIDVTASTRSKSATCATSFTPVG
jgi:hypothetical protein